VWQVGVVETPLVKVQLLGPVRAWRDEDEVAVRGVTGRSVLARLALDRGATVTIEELMDAVWGDDPPTKPAANLHTAVSRLRGALGAGAIETSAGGYAMSDAAAVDVAELQDALSGLDGADPAASQRIEACIVRFGGTPIEDVATTWVFEPYRVMLRELQLAAFDHRDASLIGAGQAESAIPDLWRRASSEPLREQTHLLLADALSRVGRATEALRVLNGFRTSLAEQSGLSPSSELDALVQRILQDDSPRTGSEFAHGTGPDERDREHHDSLHNLPSPSSRLIGRSTEIERVRRLVGNHRVVTLTGVGGCGKTRLAIAAALAMSEAFRDGIVFVDLLPVSPTRVADAIVDAGGFQIAEVNESTRVEAVARFVARRELLVVLDNCEHVIEAVADLIERIIISGTGARVLATSRAALLVDDERVFRVPGLGRSGPNDDATELLVDRAQALDDRFALDDEDRAIANEMCRRLDGLPLAIELAAAQLAHLGIADLASRLDHRLELLVGGRNWDGRSPTLQSIMEWSWELLSPVEQDLLAALSVFPGSFGLDAIEMVCSSMLPEQPAGVLRRLVNASLIEVDRSDHSVRYRLLETVRMFAAQQLTASGATDEARCHHRDWLVDWAATTSFGEHAVSSNWITAYAEVLDDVFSAIEWSMTRHDWEEAAQLLAAGAGTWHSGTRCVHAIELARKVLEQDVKPQTRARLLLAASEAALAAGMLDARAEWGNEALAAARQLDDRAVAALSATWCGIPLLVPEFERGLQLLLEGDAAADTDLVKSWTSSFVIFAEHLPHVGEPMALGMMSTWPPDSISRGGTHEVAAINDAFGGRRIDALRHVQWIRDHGPHASPMRNVLDGLEVTVEALAGDPEHALAIAPDARLRLHRTMESVWRAELLLAVAIARFRLGDVDRSLLYLEHLRTAAMNHPLIYEIRRRVARDARAAIGDRDRIAEIRLAAANIDIDRALDQELGTLA
jgi:predicted ATPase/DNA-binding SARP family transcriptional activator